MMMMSLISKSCCKGYVFLKCLVHAACSLAALFIIAKKIEARHMSINWWMGEENGVYPFKGILFYGKKRWSIDAC